MSRLRIWLAAAGLVLVLGPACFKAPDPDGNGDPNDTGSEETSGTGEGTPSGGDDGTPDNAANDTIDPPPPAANLPCISCHQFDMGQRRAVVLDSGKGSHHLGAGSLTNDECVVCHDISQHQQGIVRLWADPNDPDGIIELRKDPRSDVATAGTLVPFCAACHGERARGGHPVSGAWQPTCTVCHDLHNPGGENLAWIGSTITPANSGIGATVLFTARQGTGSFADGDPAALDGVCQVCHTQTAFHKADGTGIPHNDGTDCTTCHPHDTGFLPSGEGSCIGCHSTTQGQRPAVVDARGAGGHHLGGGALVDADCLTCHETSRHRQGRVRLWSNPNAPTTAIELLASPQANPNEADKLNGFCSSCHQGSGTAIHRVPGDWQPACAACHGLHDRDNRNLFLIRRQIHNTTLGQDRDVVFRSRTGDGSYSDGVGAADGICQACHTSTSHHRYDGSGSAHQEGQNCRACHTHHAGFLPDAAGSCITCHSSPQGSHPAVVNVDGTGGHHFGSGVLSDEDCTSCHDNSSHRQGQVRLWNDAANPSTSLVVNGDPNRVVSFCQSCHSDAGHPAVHATGTAWTPACTECHSPHDPANTNLSLVSALIHNATLGEDKPVVFTSRTGPGSFSDGVGGNDGVCQVCHTATSYHLHDGGGGGGAGHNVGADCTACHAHEAGFAPSGEASCIACHREAQGARRAVVSEFGYSSHHVSGAAVTDADCLVCHDQSRHQQGHVRLKSADHAAIVVALAGDPLTDPVEAVKLEPFCLSCHDGDGAGGEAPFADGLMPPAIDAGLWSAGSHKTGQTTCVGDGETFGCHSTGHGSMKMKLLAPFDGSQPPVAGDPLRQEEGFCYGCHDADGPAPSDIQSLFGLASRHDVSSADQSSGSKVECVNCHDPHKASASTALIHPDSGAVFSGGVTAFCLTCHDGAPPAGVQFPPSAPGSGFDKSAFVGSTHDTQLGADACMDCHDPHGSAHVATLLHRYVVGDNNHYSSGDGDYASCWACHDENAIIQQKDRFNKYHKKHVKGEDAPCIACHNVHHAYDAGEPGLIDLSYPNGHGFNFNFIDGADPGTAFWINDAGSRGNCLLRCHGEKHNPEDYRR